MLDWESPELPSAACFISQRMAQFSQFLDEAMNPFVVINEREPEDDRFGRGILRRRGGG